MNCWNLNFGSDRDLISVSQAVVVLSTYNDINWYIYIASFIPGEEKEGCRFCMWTDFTYRRTGVQSSRHTGDQLYLTQQVIPNGHVFPTWLWREETYQRSIPTSCAWSPCSSWRDPVWGRNRKNINKPTLSVAQRNRSDYLYTDQWCYMHSVVQEEIMNWKKSSENPHLWYCSCWGFGCSVPCSFEKTA